MVKNTEKATLLSILMLDTVKEVWFPNSKIEINGDTLSIDEQFWAEKEKEVAEKKDDSIIIHINGDKIKELEKSLQLSLSAELKSLVINPFLFIPKKLILERGTMETGNFDSFIKVPEWFWNKTYDEMVDAQLDYFNREKDEKMYYLKDFKLLNPIE